MLCNECKKNTATVRYVAIVGGVKKEYNLCADCARKLGISPLTAFSWGDMFALGRKSEDEKACPKCGTTLSQLKSGGVVGCEECYAALNEGIQPILRKVQKSATHIGRAPMGFEAAKLPQPSVIEGDPGPLEQLREQMQRAVEEENFELAATLRDQIRGLKEEEEHGSH